SLSPIHPVDRALAQNLQEIRKRLSQLKIHLARSFSDRLDPDRPTIDPVKRHLENAISRTAMKLRHRRRCTSPSKPYFTSTVAPASANFFLIVSASSFDTPSFTFLGAPSTRSLASFRPRLVTSRTALITLILFAPTSLRTTVNSVFSSAGAAPAAAPPPPATMTGAAAAAETPKRHSAFLTRPAVSTSDRLTIDSSNGGRSAIVFSSF